MVLSPSAAGLTHGQIGAHLAGGSGAEVSGQMITAITGRVREGPAGWPSGPLDPVSAVLFIDAIVGHEAPFDRVEVRGLRRPAVAAAG